MPVLIDGAAREAIINFLNAKALLMAAGALALQSCASRPADAPPAQSGPALITGRIEGIAHRGGAGPDGTIACAGRSLAAGIRFLELDVRLTKDGHAVILHDPTVDRTTDGTGPVAELTLELVRKLDAGAKYRDPAEPEKSYAGERIPTVQEMLHFVGARGVVLLELKVAEAAEDVVAAIRSEQAFGRAVVRSGDKGVLRRVKGLDARVLVGTMGKIPAENLDAFVDELQALGVASFTVTAAERAQVEKFRGKGIAVWGSNTNDPAAMRKFIDAGVDGIITDSCPVLAGLLRGQEPPAPAPVEEPASSTAKVALRAGVWKIPDFKAVIATGKREITNDALFDLGIDGSLEFDSFFVLLSADYAFSNEISIVSGSIQAGLQVDLGELLLPLTLRGSAGVLFARMDVEEPRFGDFDNGMGFLGRLELEGRISETVTTSLWVDYRHIEFDFKPTVLGGDKFAGGSTFAVGLSLGLRF